MTATALIEKLYKSIPYPAQITNLEIEKGDDAVRFNWRGVRYRLSANYCVEEVGNGVLIGSNTAILMEHLLREATNGA